MREGRLLYEGVTGNILRLNDAAIAQIGDIVAGGHADDVLLKHLLDARMISKVPFVSPPASEPRVPFWARAVTIFPSTDCNLRCTYCYSEGGREPTYADPRAVLAAIDFLVESVKEHPEESRRTALLSFHGGGEPLHYKTLPLVKNAILYARDLVDRAGVALELNVSTNGVLSEDTREWMVATFDKIQLSMDGPEDIQNLQRPTKGGGKSFSSALRTLRTLEDRGVDYSIRVTVSEHSLSRMREIAEFFHAHSANPEITFEAITECGRCNRGVAPTRRGPEQHEFAKEFITLLDWAVENGYKINNSAMVLQFSHTYCGATGCSFVLTPEGDVSTCLEVCRRDDPRSAVFFIGSFDSQSNSFVFDNERIVNLANRLGENLPGCQGCFSQYTCAGDCLTRVLGATGDIYDTVGAPRCNAIRSIKHHVLDSLVERHNK